MEWVKPQSRAWLAGVVGILQRTVDASPGDPKAWEKLGAAHLLAGDAAASVATLRQACSRFPTHVGIHLQLARSAQALGSYEEALEAAESALRLASASASNPAPASESAAAMNLRFSLLVKLGRLEAAEEAFAHCAAGGPAAAGDSLAVLHFAIARARSRDQWQPLLDLCDGILAHSPGSTGARYYRALALLRLGRAAEAQLDPARFLWSGPLPVTGGETESRFLAGLRREVLANPTLAPDPRGFTTTHGMQTRELLQPGDKAVPELLARIQQAVDGYEQHFARQLLASGTADPFLTARPAQATLSAWAVVYPGEGRQRSHIHPPGWLSGVYYIAAPPGGELLLGAMDQTDAAGSEVPWQVERIQPQPNLLVLFPSFIPHATEPTHAGDLRICIAFDVVPA